MGDRVELCPAVPPAEVVAALAGHELAAAAEILDIGCGSGWWLELLSARRQAARERVPSARIALGDARELPYPDRMFEVVTLVTVLSSLATAGAVAQTIREARRVLSPDGALLIWEPRLSNPRNRRTLFVSRAISQVGLAGMRTEIRTITVVPHSSPGGSAATSGSTRGWRGLSRCARIGSRVLATISRVPPAQLHGRPPSDK